MSAVTHLANSLELVGALPLAQLSVVLFTAAWSRDSSAALSALESIASTFPGPSLPPYIAFYSVPIPITEVHAVQPSIAYARSLWRFRARSQFELEVLAFNATAEIPWFPTLRIFPPLVSENGARQLLYKYTFGDSFTPHAMRRFVRDVSYEVFKRFGGLQRSTPLSLHDSIMTQASTCAPLISTRSCRPLYPAPSLLYPHPGAVIDRSQDAASSLLPRSGDPIELSPDGLTKLLFSPGVLRGSSSILHSGALLIVPGGTEATSGNHLQVWHDLTSAIDAENSNRTNSRAWVASVIDSTLYRQFSERLGVSPDAPSPALLLLDGGMDKVHVEASLPKSREMASHILRRFIDTDSGSLRKMPPLTKRRHLHLGSLEAAGRVKSVSGEELREAVWIGVQDGDSVWAIVHEPWCGFSQRAAAILRVFANTAEAVTVLEVTDVERLPEEVDRLVDGFPTILRPVISPKTGNCENKRCDYEEYDGLLTVEALSLTLTN